MASSNGGLRIGISAQGFDAAKKQLASLGRSIEPVLRGALDSTATEVRKRKYTPEIAKMFKSRGWVNKRIIIKRVNARKGRLDARIIPSGAGVYVTEYRRWGYQVISPTRARILVGSFKGHKVAAGFVNPASLGKQPWATRSSRVRKLKKPARYDQRKAYVYNTGLQPAMGPSVAFYFRRLTNVATVGYANRYLSAEFQRRYRRALLRG